MEMAKGAKGKGGEGKKRTFWTRELGDLSYLKNFRRGLRYQKERCLSALASGPSDETARDIDDRLQWIRFKQNLLDNGNEMIWDRPGTRNGRQMAYGSLHPSVRRLLTLAEISWNADLIEVERLQQRRRFASAPTQAPPAAATARARGSASSTTAAAETALGSASPPNPAAPAAATALGSAPPPNTETPSAATAIGSATPADDAPSWREVFKDSHYGETAAATKANSACEEGLTSKAGPPAKRTEPPMWDRLKVERDRQAHHQALRLSDSSKRSASATPSKEETAERRNARSDRSRSVEGTARSIALLQGAEADEVMQLKPTRRLPVVFESPHEASHELHEDWTVVPGSNHDPEKWARELRRREARNLLIRDKLDAGRDVWYRSSGSSMWPLVQSDDACTFRPIQAVTAKGGTDTIEKEASEIGVGDIVFCQVQPSQHHYAHIVLSVDDHHQEPTYWIGNIERRENGWCLREHIFGILVHVQQWWGGDRQYHSRPLPKTVFAEVQSLVAERRWNSKAAKICEARWPQGMC